MSRAYDRFTPREPALFLLQVMDGRGVWRTRKRLSSVVAALSEVAQAPSVYSGGRLRLVEAGREPATGAISHREVLRAGGGPPVSPLVDGNQDARALVSALRRCGEWAGRRPRRERVPGPRRRALGTVLATAVLLTLGVALLGDSPWGTRDDGPNATVSLGAALGSVLDAARPSIELVGAALAREIAPEPADLPLPHIGFGVSWRETLEGALQQGMACRQASQALVACSLDGGTWLYEAQNAQLLFDRRQGHLAAVLVVSRLLIDRDPDKRGLEIKRRFAEITESIDHLLPPGYTASVRVDAPTGVPFWLGLSAVDGRGAYAAHWTADSGTAGPTVSLRLYGLDADRGFYKMLVERPS